MKKNSLFLILCLLTISFANAKKPALVSNEKQNLVFMTISIFGDGTPGGWVTDTDMTTTDGTNYALNNVALVPGALKFRGNHSWDLPYNWGGTTLPSGTVVVDANGINIPSAGTYDIKFNTTTAVYSIINKTATPLVISIFGDATPGTWVTDTDMTATGGDNYIINGVALMPGALKFRGNHSWTLPYNWGGTAFPSGTAVVDADGITVPTAGTYNITFNTVSAAYTILNSLGINDFNVSNFKVYPNPAQSSWNFSSNDTIDTIQILDISGKIIKTVNPADIKATVDASGLNSGVYFAKITTATTSNTIKLIKI